MKRLLILIGVLMVLLVGPAPALPVFLDSVCACGGSKLPLGGYPIGGGTWECVYLVNSQTVVTEYHQGGCP